MSDTDPFKTNEGDVNYLEALVGDGKKFKTVEDLAKGKAESDSYIDNLKQELDAAKRAAADGKSVAELLEALKKDPAQSIGQPEGVRTETPAALKEEDIASIALKTLEKAETERKIKDNYNASVAKMQEVWGSDASKKLAEVALNVGMPVAYLQEVAKQSPAAFYQLTGLNANRSVPSGTVSPQGTVAFDPNSKKRDAAYYRKLKADNPSLFRDTKVQIQMQRDALAIGEDFFN